MILRPYQQAAIDAVYDYLRNKDGNPCLVLPTGSGKTPVMSTICLDAVKKWNGRVLVLAHVKELLEQTASTIRRIAPDLSVGVYSAGLNSRDTSEPVIIAGIQSVYNRAEELGHFDLILIDETHLIPPEGDGMYQTFLTNMRASNPHVRLIGLTATPYRMRSGMLCGPDNLLNDICFEVGVKELIDENYLCPLKTKGGRSKVDCSNLHIRAGEFISSEVEELMDNSDLVLSACREIIMQTQDRHSVLIFAASVAHADHVKETIEKYSGCECGIVTGDTPSVERENLLKRFKGQRAVGSQLELPLLCDNPLPLGAYVDERNNVKRTNGGRRQVDGTSRSPQLKFLVNVNVLTTGFDAPNVDCVILLRPTASPGLYYQMTGRGFRLHESKKDCLVLDYGGNIMRHGPVDSIRIKDSQDKCQPGLPGPMRECPNCQLIMHAAIKICPDCGYVFPEPEKKHETEASEAGILSGGIEDNEYDVLDVFYSVHTKKGADDWTPRTVRIEYRVSFNKYFSEWVCPEHDGWARKRFEKWWLERSNDPLPETAEEAVDIANAGGLAIPTTITVRKIPGEKFDKIIKQELGEIPDGVAEMMVNTDVWGDQIPTFNNDDVPF